MILVHPSGSLGKFTTSLDQLTGDSDQMCLRFERSRVKTSLEVILPAV